ncbi:MAG: VCBS repeat-containing protein [Bryobacteraceae bacterium]
MRKLTYSMIVAALAWASSARPGPPVVPFEHVIIDSHAPLNQWAIGAGDIDGDGQVDVVSSGEGPLDRGTQPVNAGLYWYEYPKWTKHTIDAAGTFADDMQLADVDGDGDLDIVVPEDGSQQVRWYENPRPNGNPRTDPWKVHVIGGYTQFHFEEAHDVEVADLNGDGKLDVFIANQKWELPRPTNQAEQVIFFQNSPGSWTPVVVSNVYGEGTCLADLNGDGKVDIVKAGWWLENPRDPMHGQWKQHWFFHGWPDRAGVTVADLNQDGRPDVALSASDSPGRLSWFEGPRDATHDPWKEHLIQDHVDYVHTFKVADINNDGSPDVVIAEMQDSVKKRVGFFLNLGKGASWQLQVVANTGSHNIRIADVDHDGDVDIIGANWDTKNDPRHAPLEMWRNLLNDRRSASH